MKLGIPGALVGGLLAALVGAAIWAAITVSTGYQIGFMAIGVGLLVGIAVRMLGGGSGAVYGVVAAVLALLGCALGNLLSALGFIASDEGIPFTSLLGEFDWSQSLDLLIAASSPMDYLFYAIAVFQAFKFGPMPDEAAPIDSNP